MIEGAAQHGVPEAGDEQGLALAAASEPARAWEERLRLLLDVTDDGFWDWNLETGEVWLSDRWRGMLGYLPGEAGLHPRNWEKLVHPDDIAGVARALERHLAGSAPLCEAEHRVRHRDGRWIWVLGRGKVVSRDPKGRPLRAVGTHRDISRRKAEEGAPPADRVDIAGAQPQAGTPFPTGTAATPAMRASSLVGMGAMAAGLVHELNQPLSAIANYAAAAEQILSQATSGTASDARAIHHARRCIGDAASQAIRAGDMVRRLREVVGRAESNPTRLPPGRIVAEAAADARSSLPAERQGAAGIELRTAVSAAARDILGDADQLRLVLRNLIRNAAEAMEGSIERRVEITARAVKGGVEFSVADTGPGIAPSVLPRLFQPIASAKPGGMGVGLAICRALVEAHGGRIWAASRKGGGAVFRFVIPAADAGPKTPG